MTTPWYDSEPVRLNVEKQSLTDVSAVRQKLTEILAESGWLCMTSWVGLFDPQKLADEVPLSAELLDRDGSSWHLRFNDGVWHLVHLIEGKEGEEVLRRQQGFCSTEKDQPHMNYVSYWRKDDQQVWQPWVARFVGFTSKEMA